MGDTGGCLMSTLRPGSSAGRGWIAHFTEEQLHQNGDLKYLSVRLRWTIMTSEAGCCCKRVWWTHPPERPSSDQDTVEGSHLAQEHLGGLSEATNEGNNALKSSGLRSLNYEPQCQDLTRRYSSTAAGSFPDAADIFLSFCAAES